ncbi:hypothetical protein [Aeromonas veronii]|uniref:hypothetical protein n=1 Tax=Aeromonas veronii TaxID=654 RepID=UPI003D191452
MSILNDESTGATGCSATTTHQVQAEQKTIISRRMHAQLKLNAHLMAQSRDDLAVELARTPNLPPQEMMNKITAIQHVAKSVEALSDSYVDAPQGELTPADVEVMKDMAKKYGQTVTAKCFSTKQPAVSDLINGKTKV